MDCDYPFIIGLAFGFVLGFGIAVFWLTYDGDKHEEPVELDCPPEPSHSARLFVFDYEPFTYTWDESIGAWVSEDGKHKVTPDDRRKEDKP